MQVETLEQIAARLGWSDERLAEARARAAETRPSNVSDSDRARPTRSRTRSTGHVTHSTKLPDEVSPPDWRALIVVLNDRAAIYAEEFPAYSLM